LAYDLGVESIQRHFRGTTPAMNDPMLPLPGLSPVFGKKVVATFDGGELSSDGGLLVLREVEQRLGVADRMPPVSSTRAPPIRSRIASPISLAFDC
jgi:hypothetical protein